MLNLFQHLILKLIFNYATLKQVQGDGNTSYEL